MKRAIPLTVPVLLLVTACGDDEVASVDSTPAPTAASTAEWCDVARDLNKALYFDQGDASDPAGLEAAFTQLAATIDAASEQAPDELEEHVTALGQGVASFVEVFESAQWDATAIDEDLGADLSETIDAAIVEIASFNEEHCGLLSEPECRASGQTLEVAVEAFIASEGRPPVDEQELVDAELIRRDIEGFEVGDGDVVATPGGGCD